MKELLITTALALCLATPALAQTGGNAGQGQRGTAMAGPQQAAPRNAETTRLISAEQLIAKDVVTADRRQLGAIDYIVVDPTTGAITTLLVRATGLAGQQQGGQAPLLSMPWHAIDVSRGGPIVARVPMQVARQVPTFTDEDIARVTSPRVMAQIVEYYAPAPQGQAGAGQGAAQDDQAEQIVIGQGVVGMLAPPAVTTVNQMRGLAITTPDGRRVGEVGTVMINADLGTVSYVLALQESDTNRLTRAVPPVGTGFIPLSFQDLELAADAQSFVLAPDAIVVGVVAVPEAQGQTSRGAAPERQAQRQQTRDQQARAGGQRGYGAEAYGPREEARMGSRAQPRSNQASAGDYSGVVRRAVLGTIASIDRRNRTLSLENGGTFQLTQRVDLSDLSPGDPVRLRYVVRGNDYRAVDIQPAPERRLSGGRQADADTGPIDGVDSPGNTDDLRSRENW